MAKDFFRKLKENIADFDPHARNRIGRKVSGEMKYEAYDESERDVYRDVDARKKKRRTPPSREWIDYLMTALVPLLYNFFTGVVTVVLVSIYRVNHLDYTEVSFSSTFWKLGFNPTILPTFKLGILLSTVLLSVIIYTRLNRNYKLQTIESNSEDLIQLEGYGRLNQPEELTQKYDIFPDNGAHSAVSPSAIISHMYITNEGLKEIEMGDRLSDNVDRYVLTKDGVNKLKKDKNNYVDDDKTLWNPYHLSMDDPDVYEELLTKKMPMIDEIFAKENYEASGVSERVRHFYNPKKLLYNPNKIRNKTDEATVAEKINNDWWMPDYEVQRPTGFYIVATGPLNAIVVAQSRAGKGQTIIEPTIDLWTRSDDKSNIIVNDPKTEILLRFYYVARKRGYELVVFNLADEGNTNVYNILGYAVDDARQGRFESCSEKVDIIGDFLFPDKSGGTDSYWNNAARSSYKRSALGLIDFYLEKEYYLRDKAAANPEEWPIDRLDAELDKMWGNVTAPNVYQMMTQLNSVITGNKKLVGLAKRPAGETVVDYLTLFFDATSMLPRTRLREQVINQDKPVRMVADSKRTLASVNSIAVTELNFFADPLIIALTNGRPSENFDIVGLSFPRRIGIRLNKIFARKHTLDRERYTWTVYTDKSFTNELTEDELGESFKYSGVVDKRYWIYYRTKGIFPAEKTYIKLEIFSERTKDTLYEFFFEFEKKYMLDSKGTSFVVDDVTDEEIVRGGYLREMIWNKEKKGYQYGHVMLVKKQRDLLNEGKEEKYMIGAIEQTDVHYSEKPKFVDFITPPNRPRAAKILLIALDQIFNQQVNEAYLATNNQRPFYITRALLDELGNLKSGEHGVPFLDRKMSIGLGQDQQFTLIEQDFSQIPAIYGSKVAETIESNAMVINYLKSNNTKTLKHLSEMSGTKQVATISSQTVQRNLNKLANANDAKIAKTYSAKEMPVVSANDMRYIPSSNNIVFGNGYPTWSRNQLALPMAWKLHQNRLRDFESDEKVTTTTVPIIGVNKYDDNELRTDFFKMVYERVSQALRVESIVSRYKKYYQVSDVEMTKSDQDELSRILMRDINRELEMNASLMWTKDDFMRENTDFKEEMAKRKAKQNVDAKKKFADHTLSVQDLIVGKESGYGTANSENLQTAFDELIKVLEKRLNAAVVKDNSDKSISVPVAEYYGFIEPVGGIEEGLQKYSLNLNTKKFTILKKEVSDEEDDNDSLSFKWDENDELDSFFEYLSNLNDWSTVFETKGSFTFDLEKEMGKIMKKVA